MTDSEIVQHIKHLHLFTRTSDEWDKKFKRFNGDAAEILAHIRRECEERYPNVDLDTFLWSYSQFDTEPRLRPLLTRSRSEFGKRLRSEPLFLVRVIQCLLGFVDPGQVPKLKKEVYDKLSELDEPLVLLMFLPFGNEPLLPPFSKKVGDLDDSVDLYSLATSTLRDVLTKIYPEGRTLVPHNPYLDKACEALDPLPTGPTARKVTIMDVVNLVYGVFDNIRVNTSPEYLRYANDAVLANRVILNLPNKMWKTNQGHYCRIDASSDGYMLSYFHTDDSSGTRTTCRTRFFLSAFYDPDGQPVAYVESARAFRRLVEGKGVPEADRAHYALKIYDDNDNLLTRLTSDSLQPRRIVLDKYVTDPSRLLPKLLNFNTLEVVNTPSIDGYPLNAKNIKSDEPDDDSDTQNIVWLSSRNYIYVQCEKTEPVTRRADDGDKSKVEVFKVKSWFRLPRHVAYTTFNRSVTSLQSVGKDDVVALRSFRENGRKREFIFFTNLSLAVEVTLVKHPEVGQEFPSGVVIVASPSDTLHDKYDIMCVQKAVYVGDSKADITYDVYNHDTDSWSTLTIPGEDIVVPQETE